ncbi:MAG: hypothetical protein AMXMBFR23_04270 [Chloroflexota bacterium]
MTESLAWLLVLLLVAGGGLLPSALLFERLPSRGVPYALPLGLAVVGLIAWLAGALVLPYGTPVAAASLAAWWAWSALIAWRRPALLVALRARWRAVALTAAATALLFAALALVRALAPDAWATEKPMDLAILTAVHRSETLPPPDPWFAGASLSYYHLGHTTMDVVGRLSGNGPATTFNLATATAGAAAAVAAAGLALDLLGMAGAARRRARLVAGGVAVAVLLFAAPAVGFIDLLAANGVGRDWAWTGIEGLPAAEGARTGVPERFWWWWNTTRVVPGTISEYPAFTLILGDPHAHLMALPIGLTVVALALVTFEGNTPLTWRRWLRRPHDLALTGALFAALAMTNLWDVVTFGGVWGLAAVIAVRRVGWAYAQALFIAVRWAAAPAGLALLLAFPFLEGLDPPPVGIAPVTGERSDLAPWLAVWLAPGLPLVLAAAWAGGVPLRWRRPLLLAALPVLTWAVAMLLQGRPGEFAVRGGGWATLLVLPLLVAWLGGAAYAADARRDRGLAASLALGAAALLVLLLTEVVHIDDAFEGRLNTVFKFWFHAWAIVAVAAGALAGIAVERAERPAWASRRLTASLVGAGAVVFVACALTVPAMLVSRHREAQAFGIDAIAYLDRTDPGLAEAGRWVRANLDPEGAVVVQAVGESYTTGNMLAASTGVPTVLGWPGHQRQWRGAVDEAARREAVDAIYTHGATPEGLAAARRYGVTHVYVGFHELTTYTYDVLGRLAGWPQVFASGATRIYEVPAEVAP